MPAAAATARPPPMPPRLGDPLQLWAGVECSVVRVGDDLRDQVAETGHRDRPGDLDLIASLGVRTLRHPLIWETVAPEAADDCDWSWHDERLGRLRALGIRVIAGLVHHGGGPRRTSLIDPLFPEKLAEFASRAAERYPWIDAWTPVNEPLTTARFACLYGFWHPHRKSSADFLIAVVNQCRGTALAMAAVRRVNRAAELIQTEDIGRTFARPAMAAQAEHDNGRRWLALDLLCGRVDGDHPWRPALHAAGVAEAALDALETGGGRPGVIGVDHYVTSDRWLDERLSLYPHEATHGLHGAYVDVEAVRVPGVPACGPALALRDAWDRYGLPLALTEIQHSCTREEQVRWLVDAWNAARTLRADGVDVRAVTAWAPFGALDWQSLLTRREGARERGMFDDRSDSPRPTLLAEAARALATTGTFDHPALDDAGWWRRDDRFTFERTADPTHRTQGRPILITGATGTLGRAFARLCAERGLAAMATTRAQLDITDPDALEAVLEAARPWAVINAAGYVRVADAEREPEMCLRENARGPEVLAGACAARGVRFVTVSSDLVFDGQAGRAYVEDDAASPTTVYGVSKLAAERGVAAAAPDALVVRTSAFFGPWDRHNFLWHAMSALRRGEPFVADADTTVSPTFVPDLVHATLDLLLDGESGLWHLANPGRVTWLDFARSTARRAGLDPDLVRAGPPGPAADTSLTSRRGVLLRPLEDAVGLWLNAFRGSPPTG